MNTKNKIKTRNDQRSTVKNPTSSEFIVDKKNSVRQMQKIADKTPEQEDRMKNHQRDLSKALQRQQLITKQGCEKHGKN